MSVAVVPALERRLADVDPKKARRYANEVTRRKNLLARLVIDAECAFRLVRVAPSATSPSRLSLYTTFAETLDLAFEYLDKGLITQSFDERITRAHESIKLVAGAKLNIIATLVNTSNLTATELAALDTLQLTNWVTSGTGAFQGTSLTSLAATDAVAERLATAREDADAVAGSMLRRLAVAGESLAQLTEHVRPAVRRFVRAVDARAPNVVARVLLTETLAVLVSLATCTIDVCMFGAQFMTRIASVFTQTNLLLPDTARGRLVIMHRVAMGVVTFAAYGARASGYENTRYGVMALSVAGMELARASTRALVDENTARGRATRLLNAVAITAAFTYLSKAHVAKVLTTEGVLRFPQGTANVTMPQLLVKAANANTETLSTRAWAYTPLYDDVTRAFDEARARGICTEHEWNSTLPTRLVHTAALFECLADAREPVVFETLAPATAVDAAAGLRSDWSLNMNFAAQSAVLGLQLGNDVYAASSIAAPYAASATSYALPYATAAATGVATLGVRLGVPPARMAVAGVYAGASTAAIVASAQGNTTLADASAHGQRILTIAAGAALAASSPLLLTVYTLMMTLVLLPGTLEAEHADTFHETLFNATGPSVARLHAALDAHLTSGAPVDVVRAAFKQLRPRSRSRSRDAR